MEKKSGVNNSNSKSKPKPKSLQSKSVVELSGDEGAKLVGGIVEKGMSQSQSSSQWSSSSPISAPRPSILPFPVARHRSHGPHWTPNVSQYPPSATRLDSYDDDDEQDNKDNTTFADFAMPIQKKDKKTLDFTTWKQLAPPPPKPIASVPMQPHCFIHSPSSKTNHSLNLDHHQSAHIHSQPNSVPLHQPCGNDTDIIGHPTSLNLDVHVDLPREEFSSPHNPGVGDDNNNNNSVGQTTIEGQIDAENRALLQRMSPQEIAEAQADIRNRFNPQLLNTLKRRGLQKLDKHRNPSCASAHTQDDQHAAKGKKEASAPQTNISPTLNSIEKRPEDGVAQNLISEGSNLWDAWSKRVEAVRNLRFSLDGNLILGSSLGQTYNADNVAERDFLRTEGDPGAAGYTIKEALALVRSIVPGQRALALHLLASVLSKALHSICESQLDCTSRVRNENSVDSEAIWAYALGPEPELVLSLRMALDDNHNSVVLASAKVIQCILACDVNENFFNILEKMAAKDLYTAPVFRSRPDIKYGFLGGGFWKYSTKHSKILLPDVENLNDMNEGEHTIQDDNIVAGQDVAAGLVRMGILPRLCYILGSDPAVALEECTLSILVALARHSPTCANAVWKCERLVQTIIDRFILKDTLELQALKIKSLTLLRVLAQSSRTICTEFIKKGFFQIVTWQLCRATSSVDEWLKCGRENCKLASELMIEQLRFWKVCIMYDLCVPYFSSFYPALCLWLNPPTFDKLMETNAFHEFAAISKEVYLVLEALATKLPDPYSSRHTNHQILRSYGDDVETWCWSDVGPMIDSALKWMELMSESTLSKLYYQENGVKSQFDAYVPSLLWIMSAISHMLHTILVKATPGNAPGLNGGSKTGPNLPDYIAKIAFQIIKSGVLDFPDQSTDEQSTKQCRIGFFIEKLCHIRHESDTEASLASVWCLHGLFRVIVSVDCLIELIGNEAGCTRFYNKVHEASILKSSLTHWRRVTSELVELVASKWHFVHNIEVFGRGGPAPGVGVGWGAVGGGFWSLSAALGQADAALLTELLETFHSSPAIDFPGVTEESFITKSVSSAIASSLMAGPGDKMMIHKVLDVLLQIPVLKYFDQCISHFLHCYHGQELFKREYTEGDLMQYSMILGSHFRTRWLSVKKIKPKAKEGKGSGSKIVTDCGNSLDTIHEDVETLAVTSEDSNSLTAEWAHQRLPLPSHWLLSPITSIIGITTSNMPNTSARVPPVQELMEFTEVAKAGLFFLLGIEAMSVKLSEDNSPLRSIPLIWKLHSLSVALLAGMGLLEDERSRNEFEALQFLYGRQLDEIQFNSEAVAHTGLKHDTLRVECLRFQSEIHENYSAFIETLVEQFAAISYGDYIYGRQIAIYLHRQVDASVRLATWNALSNARVLELLPPLGECLSPAKGYLEPIEEDHGILEAFVKSWISGSLDRAATRGSVTYAVAVHQLSSFIFNNCCGDKLLLRNKLVKSLLRDYSRNQRHEGMMLEIIRYNYCLAIEKLEQDTTTPSLMNCIDQRFELLKEACEGNSQLLTVAEKLKSSILETPQSKRT